MSTTTRPCDRCGRRVAVNHSRKRQPVTVCRDCRAADPTYLQLINHSKEHAA